MDNIKCFIDMTIQERIDFLEERGGYIEDGIGLNECGHEIGCDCEIGCGERLRIK